MAFERRSYTRFDLIGVRISFMIRRDKQAFLGRCPDAFRRRHGRNNGRSEEHTSELQSLAYLVCRLLLEKKKKTNKAKFYAEQMSGMIRQKKSLAPRLKLRGKVTRKQ